MLLFSLIVALAIVWAARRVADAMRDTADRASADRALQLVSAFAAATEAQGDPSAMVIWETHARRMRAIFPKEFARLDGDAGRSFPYTKAQLEAAHAQWTADWLAWEQAHDAEYKLKAALAQHESASKDVGTARAQAESIEREKLDRYQRRYQEYVRVAKALQGFASGS